MVRVRRLCFLAVIGAALLLLGLAYAGRAGAATWAIQKPAVPKGKGAPDEELDGVSCTSSKVCIAVGYSGSLCPNSPDCATPIIERWSGSRWTLLEAAIPAGSSSSLSAVSCASRTDCSGRCVSRQGWCLWPARTLER